MVDDNAEMDEFAYVAKLSYIHDMRNMEDKVAEVRLVAELNYWNGLDGTSLASSRNKCSQHFDAMVAMALMIKLT